MDWNVFYGNSILSARDRTPNFRRRGLVENIFINGLSIVSSVTVCLVFHLRASLRYECIVVKLYFTRTALASQINAIAIGTYRCCVEGKPNKKEKKKEMLHVFSGEKERERDEIRDFFPKFFSYLNFSFLLHFPLYLRRAICSKTFRAFLFIPVLLPTN